MEVRAMEDTGRRYVRAVADKDTETLRSLFAPDVDFRGMTPGRFWEATSPDEVIAILFEWFDAHDVIESVDYVEAGAVVDRARIDFRARVRNPDGLHLVEQRAYFDVDDDGRIAHMHVACSGFRPITAAAG